MSEMPKLEQATSLNQTDLETGETINWNTTLSESVREPSSYSTNNRPTQETKASEHLKFTRNIERFCNEVTSNKLLWTPSVLDFFEIEKKFRRAYETEREKASQQRKVD